MYNTVKKQESKYGMAVSAHFYILLSLSPSRLYNLSIDHTF